MKHFNDDSEKKADECHSEIVQKLDSINNTNKMWSIINTCVSSTTLMVLIVILFSSVG